jgi:hypothetical protein
MATSGDFCVATDKCHPVVVVTSSLVLGLARPGAVAANNERLRKRVEERAVDLGFTARSYLLRERAFPTHQK